MVLTSSSVACTLPTCRGRSSVASRRHVQQRGLDSARSLKLLPLTPRWCRRSIRRCGLQRGRVSVARAAAPEASIASEDTDGDSATGSHVHIGAGRLGLGLVIPAIEASGVPYAILQRPSKAWSKLVNSGEEAVSLIVNDEPVTAPLKLVNDKDAEEEDLDPDDLFVCDVGRSCGNLVLSNDSRAWDSLIRDATSFSTSVGSSVASWLGPMLSQLPEVEPMKRPVLYACENDSGAVKDLAAQLEGRVEVIPCMVDRICAGREVTGGSEPAITIQAEEHKGSIVLLNPPEDDSAVIPLKGDGIVTVPSSAATGAYLYHRKLVMVNGMHTTLAFLTLVWNEMQREEGCPGEVAGYACEDLVLLTYDTAPEEVKGDIWCWAVAQILKLMWENEESLMKDAHGANSPQELVDDFLEIARLNQRRFASLDDTTARVLGGGVSNRYMGRLVPVQDAAHAVQAMSEDWSDNNAMKLLLETAGVNIDDVVTACDKLVGRAWRYCRRDEVLQRYVETGEVLFTPEDRRDSINQYDRSLSMAEMVQLSGDSLKATLKEQAIILDEAADGVQAGPVSLLADKVAVIFDVDGTLVDTEVAAMEVNYWTLVPYMPSVGATGLESQALTPAARDAFEEENAGKNFTVLLAEVEAQRAAAGLPTVAETRKAQAEDPAVLRRVDRYRQRLGLRTHRDMRNELLFGEELEIREQQQEDVITALGKMSLPNDHVPDTLESLNYLGVPVAITSTNAKPRVALSLTAAGLMDWFTPAKIHSGESDFAEPKFKPNPDVYFSAVKQEGATPQNCVAVEDSCSGVGAAANAGMGLIIGYVGSSHIKEDMEEHHAYSLLSGSFSENGQGADIVVSDMNNIVPLVTFFRNLQDRSRPFSFPDALINQMPGMVWLPCDLDYAVKSGEEIIDVSR